MKFTHRFFIYAPFALFVILALGASVRWWLAASDFSRRLDAENGHAIAPGVTLHFASKRIAGFPFRLDAVFKDLEIDVDTPRGPLRWRTGEFALHTLTYGRVQTILEAAGPQRLDWTAMDGKTRDFTFVPGALHASAIDDDGGLSRFDLDIVAVGSPALTAAQAQIHIRRGPDHDGLDVFVEADGIRLAPRNHSALGDEIPLVKIQGTVAPGAPFNGMRAGRAPWLDAVEAWRNADGAFRVDSGEIRFRDFDAMGKGALSLDDAHRPSGSVDFKFAGFARFVEHARAGGREGAGKAIATALLDRAAKAGSGDAGMMGAVIGIKDGIAYVGDEPVGMVGPLY